MRPEYISASRIQQYLMCPLKYKLVYIDHVEPDFTPSSLALGSRVHSAIEGFYRTWQDGIRMSLDEVTDLFNGYWSGETDGKSFEPDCDPDAVKRQGINLMNVFAKDVQPGKALAIEEQFRVPLVDQDTGEYLTDLVGVFDLLEAGVVVDHKTMAKRPSDADLDQNLQLSCYGYAFRILQELGDNDVLLRVDCLVKNKKPVFEQRFTVRTPETDRRLFKLAVDVLNAIDKCVFPPISGWQCGTCQVKSHCYFQAD